MLTYMEFESFWNPEKVRGQKFELSAQARAA